MGYQIKIIEEKEVNWEKTKWKSVLPSLVLSLSLFDLGNIFDRWRCEEKFRHSIFFWRVHWLEIEIQKDRQRCLAQSVKGITLISRD
jgi:hypothetical protein